MHCNTGAGCPRDEEIFMWTQNDANNLSSHSLSYSQLVNKDDYSLQLGRTEVGFLGLGSEEDHEEETMEGEDAVG